MNPPPRADQRHGTIARLAQDAAARWGDRPAIVDGAVRLSFADVAGDARRTTGALIAGGVDPGDRVALWAPNSAAWVVAALGVLGTGAWLVPLNTRFKAAEAAEILRRSDARTLLVVDGFNDLDLLGGVAALDPGLRALRHVVRLPAPGRYDEGSWPAFLDSGHDHADAADARIGAGKPEDISDLIFTSGTTGLPKGVMLRHGTSLRCYESYNTSFCLGEGDRHLVTTPFFHCFGYKAGWMLSLLVGATTYPMAVFDAGQALQTIEEHRITHMPGAPTIFTSLLHHPNRPEHDLSSLRVAIVAAATIPEDLPRRMASDLGFASVMSGYGLTENHALGTFTRPDDPPGVVATTVGRPAPDIDLRIVDDAGKPVPDGHAGELLLGGYAHMSGYYLDPDATSAVLHDGWLATGDVGYVDEDGYVHITDRKKDLFIMGGFNVAPAEVEKALAGLVGVSEVAVVGVPDERFGEVGAAFVVPAPGATLTTDAVLAHARAVMANFKVPRHVEVVSDLPRNATGKVQKHLLRSAYFARAESKGPDDEGEHMRTSR
jgi:acyl-CoA synthetase (AMP-forming)/AMP-acid ligase II